MPRRHKWRRNIKNQRKLVVFSIITVLSILSVGYAAFQTVVSINAKGHVIFDERCVVGNVFNFEQKDEIQEFVVPCSGTYKLETWGAQGGYALDNSNRGGYGGYSTGNISLKRTEHLYVVIGGKGEENTTNERNHISNGGYNGGGNAGDDGSTSWAGGGGATHIALDFGLLSTLSLHSSDNRILIVSGGGGGAGWYWRASVMPNNGGDAGGYLGNNGSGYLYGTGGSQEQGGRYYIVISYGADITNINYGEFGRGASYFSYGNTFTNVSGGGGSGFYGGGSGYTFGGSAGGGSSYIGNNLLIDKSMYCYGCEESLDLTKPEIFTVSTTGTSSYRDTTNCPDGYSENPVSKCAKKGDGFAKITLLSRN